MQPFQLKENHITRDAILLEIFYEQNLISLQSITGQRKLILENESALRRQSKTLHTDNFE